MISEKGEVRIPSWTSVITNEPLVFAFDHALRSTHEIIGEDSIQRGIRLLPSFRRVSRVFGGDILSINRWLDIAYDASSFALLPNFSEPELKEAATGIYRLAAGFYDLAKTKMDTLPRYTRRSVDKTEEYSLCVDLINDIIWKHWLPSGDTPNQQAENLYRFISGNIQFLPSRIVRQAGPSEERFYEERYSRSGILYEADHANDRLFDSTWDNFYLLVKPMNLKQVFSVIEQLDTREARALLSYLGYSPDGKMTHIDIAKAAQMDISTLLHDFYRSISHFEKILATLSNHQSTTPIHEIITRVWSTPILKLNGEIVKFDSPRIQLSLSGVVSDAQFINSLSSRERDVLQLSVATQGDSFVYSTDEIARKLNLISSTAVHIITRIYQLYKSREPRFFNDRGSKIQSTFTQYKLITRRPHMTPGQLAGLTPKQRLILDYLTTPDEKGQYPTADYLPQQKGTSKGIIKEIARKSDSEGLTYLKNNLMEAMANPDLFSERQLQVIQTLLKMISEGRSIGGNKGSIQARALSKELGLYPEYIHVLINRFIPNRLGIPKRNREKKGN